MKLDIPDHIVARAEMTSAELRTSLAIQLYADNRVDHDDAMRLSGLSERSFDRELLSRDISIQKPNSAGARRRKKRLAG